MSDQKFDNWKLEEAEELLSENSVRKRNLFHNEMIQKVIWKTKPISVNKFPKPICK